MHDLDPSLRWQQAEQFNAQGQRPRAMAAYQELTNNPEMAALAHLRLSLCHQQTGGLREATSQALAAFNKAGADPDVIEMLAKRLLRLGETHAALACAHALLRLDAPVTALAEVGKMFSDHMEPDVALHLLHRAKSKGLPQTPVVSYLLGLNHLYLGQFDVAQDWLETSIRANPNLAPAHWALAKLGEPATRGTRIDRLRACLATAATADAPLLWYCLFHELDADDAREDAWQALSRAMPLRRAQVPHDEARQDQRFRAAEDALARVPGSHTQHGATDDDGPQPIFVVGLPRTGTTLVEQALHHGYGVASVGELRDLTWQMRWLTNQPGGPHLDAPLLDAASAGSPAQLGARYLEHTHWRARGCRFFADKWPENHLAVGSILQALPHARVVWLRRSPMDACFSNLKEWFAASYFYSYAFDEMARHWQRFDRLMRRVEALEHPRVAVVDYETYVDQPQATLHALAARLDLGVPPLHPTETSDTIGTASSVQVRAGLSRRYIGAWQRYQDHLEPLRQALSSQGADPA